MNQNITKSFILIGPLLLPPVFLLSCGFDVNFPRTADVFPPIYVD